MNNESPLERFGAQDLPSPCSEHDSSEYTSMLDLEDMYLGACAYLAMIIPRYSVSSITCRFGSAVVKLVTAYQSNTTHSDLNQGCKL